MRASAILLCIRRKSRIPERRPSAPVRRIVPPGLIGSNSITSTPEQRLFLASQKLAVRVSDRARVVRDYTSSAVPFTDFHHRSRSLLIKGLRAQRIGAKSASTEISFGEKLHRLIRVRDNMKRKGGGNLY